MQLITNHKHQIANLCEKHKVNSLFVFGSVLTDKFGPSSDLDFIVDFKGVDLASYADNFFEFKFALEDLLGREIDLLESQAISNPYLKRELEKTRQPVYGVAS